MFLDLTVSLLEGFFALRFGLAKWSEPELLDISQLCGSNFEANMKLKAEESLLANFSIYNRLPKNWFSIERNTWLDLITLQLAYWHSLRLSKQSALVCSDYSLLIDPKKSRGPDQQQDRGHSAWLGLKKTCRWAVAWFLHVLPCSTKFCRLCCWITQPANVMVRTLDLVGRWMFYAWCILHHFAKIAKAVVLRGMRLIAITAKLPSNKKSLPWSTLMPM